MLLGVLVRALRPGTAAGIDKHKSSMINAALFYAVPFHWWLLCLQSPVDVSWRVPPFLSTMGAPVVPL
jgi:hypothetical protein